MKGQIRGQVTDQVNGSVSDQVSSKGFEYQGAELELFKQAINWKKYYKDIISPYIGNQVLEVGAGIGGTTLNLCEGVNLPGETHSSEGISSGEGRDREDKKWCCLEPDETHIAELQRLIDEGLLPIICEPMIGVIEDIPLTELYDSILYIDVLEHIADDRRELADAVKHLKPGGYLIVLSPAHNWLYSPFDKAIGHFRRYSLSSLSGSRGLSGLLSGVAESVTPVMGRYADAIGMFASLLNRILLRSTMPNERQILLWDRIMVPVSRLIDPLLFNRVGKTVIVVWQRQ